MSRVESRLIFDGFISLPNDAAILRIDAVNQIVALEKSSFLAMSHVIAVYCSDNRIRILRPPSGSFAGFDAVLEPGMTRNWRVVSEHACANVVILKCSSFGRIGAGLVLPSHMAKRRV